MRVLLILWIVLLLAAGGFALALAGDEALRQARVLQGVTVEGIPLGGLTVDDARRAVAGLAQARFTRTLAVRAGPHLWRPTLAELGVDADVDGAVATALALGRERNLVARVRARWRLRRGVDLPLEMGLDEGRLRDAVLRFAGRVNAPPVDAAVTVVEDQVVLTQAGEDGWSLDVVETIRRVQAAVRAGTKRVEAAGQVIRPRFSTAAALAIQAPLGAYRTRFVNIRNRNHNIALAASKVRGIILLPGAAFSFNEAVGPRTSETGYLPAPVLINNELVPGDGGGVCQVSSTLFNAALLAGLEITERANHSRPVAYLPIGRDATVVYGAIDLRVRNTTEHPMLLWSAVRGRSLTITIYGPSPDVARVGAEVGVVVTARRLIPPPARIVTRQDRDLPAGHTLVEPAKPGYIVQTYRVFRRDGVVVRTDFIGRSVYRPVPQTIRIGTKQVAAVPQGG